MFNPHLCFSMSSEPHRSADVLTGPPRTLQNEQEFEDLWRELEERAARLLNRPEPGPSAESVADPCFRIPTRPEKLRPQSRPVAGTPISQPVAWVPSKSEAEAEIVEVALAEMPWGPGEEYSPRLRALLQNFCRPDKRGRIRCTLSGRNGETVRFRLTIK